jgi:hypothetical protein
LILKATSNIATHNLYTSSIQALYLLHVKFQGTGDFDALKHRFSLSNGRKYRSDYCQVDGVTFVTTSGIDLQFLLVAPTPAAL